MPWLSSSLVCAVSGSGAPRTRPAGRRPFADGLCEEVAGGVLLKLKDVLGTVVDSLSRASRSIRALDTRSLRRRSSPSPSLFDSWILRNPSVRLLTKVPAFRRTFFAAEPASAAAELFPLSVAASLRERHCRASFRHCFNSLYMSNHVWGSADPVAAGLTMPDAETAELVVLEPGRFKNNLQAEVSLHLRSGVSAIVRRYFSRATCRFLVRSGDRTVDFSQCFPGRASGGGAPTCSTKVLWSFAKSE